MSTAFLCGNLSEFALNTLGTQFIEAVKKTIEEYSIDKVFLVRKNDFEYRFFVLSVMSHIENVEFVEIIDKNKKDIEYREKMDKGVQFEKIAPFEKEINNKCFYRTLYNYAMENSDYMITFNDFDEDISAVIAERAEEKGLKVINMKDYFSKTLFGYKLKGREGEYLN